MKRTKAIRVAMTALTLALCAALCASVLSLYAEGLARRRESGSAAAPVFTREGVVRQAKRVSPLAALWLAAAVAAAAAGALAPPCGLFAARVAAPPPKRSRPKTALRVALYAAALLLLALGVFNGGLNDVLVKAINICTECIGLG